ncbi:MAG TPA: hypothetical protein VM600_03210 [Actinomycetota bacterium]|nr:hypothetical protein [Actinomycetota bacterium]
MPKSAARQFLVKVAGVDGHFARKSGGDVTSETTKVYDGGSLDPEIMTSPASPDNVTVSRPYDARRDAPLLKRLRGDVGRFRTSISVQATDADLVPIAGTAEIYTGAVLVRAQGVEVDASSGEPTFIELEFAVSKVV